MENQVLLRVVTVVATCKTLIMKCVHGLDDCSVQYVSVIHRHTHTRARARECVHIGHSDVDGLKTNEKCL